jgi:hypothetical protein
VKHSQASEVQGTTELQVAEDGCPAACIRIINNGRGITGTRQGRGLKSMRRRGEHVNAHVESHRARGAPRWRCACGCAGEGARAGASIAAQHRARTPNASRERGLMHAQALARLRRRRTLGTMNSIAAIASSGLGAAWLGADVAANNIANAMTPGYRREQLLQQADPAGGVSASVTRLPQPGDDLVADLVGQQMAAYSFKANVRVLQTADSMMGSLLDAFA